jgi:hypothetical protein
LPDTALAISQQPLGHPMTATTTPPHTHYQNINTAIPLTTTHCHPTTHSHIGSSARPSQKDTSK